MTLNGRLANSMLPLGGDSPSGIAPYEWIGTTASSSSPPSSPLLPSFLPSLLFSSPLLSSRRQQQGGSYSPLPSRLPSPPFSLPSPLSPPPLPSPSPPYAASSAASCSSSPMPCSSWRCLLRSIAFPLCTRRVHHSHPSLASVLNHPGKTSTPRPDPPWTPPDPSHSQPLPNTTRCCHGCIPMAAPLPTSPSSSAPQVREVQFYLKSGTWFSRFPQVRSHRALRHPLMRLRCIPSHRVNRH